MKITFSTKRKLVIARRYSKLIQQQWIWCLTICFIVVALFVLIFSSKLEVAAQVGDYLSGFAGALAFIWLIASFRLQANELALQRKELAHQRKALYLQTRELQTMGEFAALDQVAKMTNNAVKKLTNSKSTITEPGQLSFAAMPTPEWKIILESTNPQEVYDSFLAWSTNYGTAFQFLSSMVIASKLYLKATNNQHVDYFLSDSDFFYINKAWIEKIPHISEYFYPTYMFAQQVWILEKGLKSIELAGAVSANKVFNRKIMKEEYIESLVKYHEDKDLIGPAIAEFL